MPPRTPDWSVLRRTGVGCVTGAAVVYPTGWGPYTLPDPQMWGFSSSVVGDPVRPAVYRYVGTSTSSGELVVPSNGIVLHPGPNGECAIVRFTAPTPGTYTISGRFLGALQNPRIKTPIAGGVGSGDGVTPSISFVPTSGIPTPALGVTLAPGTTFGGPKAFSGSLMMAAGEAVEFAVHMNGDLNNGTHGYSYDSTLLELVIERSDVPIPPVSTCCPPVNKQMVNGMFRHEGNSASTYIQPLDLINPSSTVNSFVTGLNAYFLYLQTLCPKTVGFKAEFFTGQVSVPLIPGAIGPSGMAGPLTGLDLTVPKSSISVNSGGLTVAGLNSALTAMNTFSHVNGLYYRISVKIVGINAAGQPVNCGFNAEECQRDDTAGFSYDSNARKAPGSTPYTD